MSNGNDFQQYGFDHYEQGGVRRRGLVGKIKGSAAFSLLRSPLIATVLFLLVAAGIAGIVISSYPDEAGEGEAPVVKADQYAYKQAPSEPGGMDIENRDNTVYMSMQDQPVKESAPIENLLEEDEPLDRLEKFARQVEEAAEQEDFASADEQRSDAAAAPKKIENLLGESDASNEVAVAPQPAPKAQPKPAARASSGGVTYIPPEAAASAAEQKALSSRESTASRVEPPSIAGAHSAGSNPETIEFVRSVLDKKDAQDAGNASDVASRSAAAVEPAAGSLAAKGIKPGDYYVQLASVTSPSGAVQAWGKLQGDFPSQLTGLKHRVSSADLGAKGTYYRIQAGPMSKDSADRLCAEIKAQKPGGCLVVSK